MRNLENSAWRLWRDPANAGAQWQKMAARTRSVTNTHELLSYELARRVVLTLLHQKELESKVVRDRLRTPHDERYPLITEHARAVADSPPATDEPSRKRAGRLQASADQCRVMELRDHMFVLYVLLSAGNRRVHPHFRMAPRNWVLEKDHQYAWLDSYTSRLSGQYTWWWGDSLRCSELLDRKAYEYRHVYDSLTAIRDVDAANAARALGGARAARR